MRSGNPEDPRARRTRVLLLAEAEREIVRSGCLLTVATLVQAAAVSRGAFYTHFSSIEVLRPYRRPPPPLHRLGRDVRRWIGA
ncbi:helix-turn-helix transcriptional regulator [Rhodococcus opacus]|nr:helix-turn-helix transcriptional regulator [Rhodococcus opacus]RZL71537.1 MAG: TetR family transcriptional regulator [Rhodococcus sp. (in: high G+C Gram-positive bacteria)]